MPIAAKLDEWGTPAWIALTVVGFIFWWPIGLATLAFVIWSGRMGCGRHGGYDRLRTQNGADAAGGGGGQSPSSGNRAFDEYESETLRRLEEEQKEFHEFLDRLRFAKDQTEFDQFMAERRDRPQSPQTQQPQS